MLRGCCVVSLRIVWVPELSVIVPPPVLRSWTQSKLFGRRLTGPMATFDGSASRSGLFEFQLATVDQSLLPLLVQSAGTRKSLTNSMLPLAASWSAEPLAPPETVNVPFCQNAQGLTPGSRLLVRVLKLASQTP